MTLIVKKGHFGSGSGVSRQPRVVILGGGFAGAYAAQSMRRLVKKGGAKVTLIDRNNYFVFHPLLLEAGTGSLQPRHVVVSIRSFLRGVGFHMGEITEVDLRAQRVRFRLSATDTDEVLDYDHLVLALGGVTRLPDVPGARKHGYEIKNLRDAVRLRDRAIELLEAADASGDPEARLSLLHWVIVGGNHTGVEAVGELEVFLRDAVRHYPKLKPRDVRLTLIEITDRILPGMDAGLSAYAVERLRRRGVDVLLNRSVTAVERDRVRLSTGEVLAARTVVWCAGIAPNPLIAGIEGLPLDTRGYIVCERDLRVRGYDNVWGIGDGAVNPDPSGHGYPATAQHAVREGVACARNLSRVIRGEATVPFVFGSVGEIAPLGCRTGVARVFGLRFSGFAAWFLWRSVYLFKMPGWSRRLRVALDWTLDLLFPREVVQLGLGRKNEGIAEERVRKSGNGDVAKVEEEQFLSSYPG